MNKKSQDLKDYSQLKNSAYLASLNPSLENEEIVIQSTHTDFKSLVEENISTLEEWEKKAKSKTEKERIENTLINLKEVSKSLNLLSSKSLDIPATEMYLYHVATTFMDVERFIIRQHEKVIKVSRGGFTNSNNYKRKTENDVLDILDAHFKKNENKIKEDYKAKYNFQHINLIKEYIYPTILEQLPAATKKKQKQIDRLLKQGKPVPNGLRISVNTFIGVRSKYLARIKNFLENPTPIEKT